MSLRTRFYIALVCVPGFALIGTELSQWQSESLLRYVCYFLVGMMTAGLKVKLPSITGTLSVNFLFVLFGIVALTLPETILMASVMTAIQCLWNPRRRSQRIQVAFNVAAMTLTTEAAYRSFSILTRFHVEALVRLVLAASIFFVVNTFLVAVVIALTGHKPILSVWHDSYLWSFPYYIAGAAVAGLMNLANKYIGWQTALLVVPVVYLIYRSYRLYLGRLDDEMKHAEEMAALHLRTIEALALAIEAKDHTTHDHLERVQLYAMEIGKDLGLSSDDLEALQAASLLHDIGKLAVPEHIISKPGRLTPEEFDKIKIHPVVGAEILERVQFPYPVAPIVMSHHERWDGSGYPQGLAGENIPIGARILSAVDCLDALASNRQYRRALPLHEAMCQVASEAGKTFDPRVVEVLQNRYVDLEQMAVAKQENSQPAIETKMRADVAPAAGFEKTHTDDVTNPVDFLQSIAAARQEVQSLFELAQDLGNSLSLDETLSVLAVRLRRMIPCDSMAIYVRRDQVLVPEYVTGDDFRLFSSLQIPMGQGLSGWVAENRRPIVNGNPSVEPGYLNDSNQFSKLRSALAVPLEGLAGVLGVLSLYRAEKDAFSKDHLRILLAISSKVALSVENALRFRQAEDSATVDYLTSLPNARSLFLHLDAELSRAGRMKLPLAVVVCDLDGFKQVNDSLGHLQGNKLLRLVAQGLKESCRDSDFVARMSGDEFVLVLPGLSLESVELRCESFCGMVSNAGRQISGPGALGMSIGQAIFPADGADVETLLAEADRRMYQQKSRKKLRTPPNEGLKECTVGTVQ